MIPPNGIIQLDTAISKFEQELKNKQIDPNTVKLGRASGYYLTFKATKGWFSSSIGWRIEKLNIFERFFRWAVGCYKTSHVSTVQKELQSVTTNPEISQKLRNFLNDKLKPYVPLPAVEMQKLRQYLRANGHGNTNATALNFTYKGTEYKAWYNPVHNSVLIQESQYFHLRRPDTKFSVTIGDDGSISKVFIGTEEQSKGTAALTDLQRELLLNVPQLPPQQPVPPPQPPQQTPVTIHPSTATAAAASGPPQPIATPLTIQATVTHTQPPPAALTAIANASAPIATLHQEQKLQTATTAAIAAPPSATSIKEKEAKAKKGNPTELPEDKMSVVHTFFKNSTTKNPIKFEFISIINNETYVVWGGFENAESMGNKGFVYIQPKKYFNPEKPAANRTEQFAIQISPDGSLAFPMFGDSFHESHLTNETNKQHLLSVYNECVAKNEAEAKAKEIQAKSDAQKAAGLPAIFMKELNQFINDKFKTNPSFKLEFESDNKKYEISAKTYKVNNKDQLFITILQKDAINWLTVGIDEHGIIRELAQNGKEIGLKDLDPKSKKLLLDALAEKPGSNPAPATAALQQQQKVQNAATTAIATATAAQQKDEKVTKSNPENLPKEKIKDLRDFLISNHHTFEYQNPKGFFFRGVFYRVWFKEEKGIKTISIQRGVNYHVGSALNKKEKFSIKIGNDGTIEDVYVDNQPAGLNAIQDKTRQMQILAALYTCFPSAKPEPLAKEDWLAFETYMKNKKKMEIDVKQTDGTKKKYVVWYKQDSDSYNIQGLVSYNGGIAHDKLGFQIKDGKIVSIHREGEKDEAITTEQDKILIEASFREVLKNSSKYSASHHPSIDVIKRGLKVVPEHHLKEFHKMLKHYFDNQTDQKFFVKFLTSVLIQEEGIDAGGLTRDFLDDLFTGIRTNPNCSFMTLENGSTIPLVKVPEADAKTLASLDTSRLYPKLSQEESDIYKQMGAVFMYCYYSQNTNPMYDNTAMIGRHFNDAVFSAALCLTHEEIVQGTKEGVANLPLDTKIKMCQHFLDAQGMAYNRKLLANLKNFDTLNSAELTEMEELLRISDPNSDQFDTELAASRSDDKKYKAFLKHKLENVLFISCKLGALLGPALAIASGMSAHTLPGISVTHPTLLTAAARSQKRSEEWNKEFNSNKKLTGIVMSTKIQGTMDPEEIVKNTQVTSEDPVIKTKAKWLKEWILEAKRDELNNFLKYVTGAGSLQTNKPLTIQWGEVDFQSHTCTPAIDFTPTLDPKATEEQNKKNFFDMLRSLKVEGKSYTKG